MKGIQTSAELSAAIKAATPENPVFLRLAFPGDPDVSLPFEVMVSAYNVPLSPTPGGDPSPPVPNTITLWAADIAKNVRDKANGAIVGQLAYLASVDVDMATKTTLAGHDWVKITSANFKDRWIAADVLSATRP
jgi:hypothetical protein